MALERRRHRRQKPQIGFTLRWAVGSGSAVPSQEATQILNVSPKGACIVVATPLIPGTSLKIEIAAPEAKLNMSLGATVRWTMPAPAGTAPAYLVGLEFNRVVESLGDKEDDPQTFEILQTLRVAVSQLRLYPQDSPQVLKAVTDTYNSVQSYLERHEKLLLARTPLGLMVGGRPLQAVNAASESRIMATLNVLSDSSIKSITFLNGLTLEELLTFLIALCKKFWDLKEGNEINRRLREERVSCVTVDEIQYVALSEGDVVIEDVNLRLSGANTELAKFMAALEQVLESAMQAGVGQEVRLQIIKRLLDEDPTLLRRAVGGTAPADNASSGGPPGGLLSFDQARGIVAEIARLAQEVEPVHAERLRRLGLDLVDIFCHDPSLRTALRVVFGEKAGAVIFQPAPTGEPPVVLRATVILGLALDDKIRALGEEGGGLIEELSALGRRDLIRSLMLALLEPTRERPMQRRLAACHALAGLQRALEKHAPDEIPGLERTVLEALKEERDANVYRALTDLAVFLADLRVRQGCFDRAREVVGLLDRHHRIKEPEVSHRVELAYTAMERIASGTGMAAAAPRMDAGDPEALRLVESLGMAATRYLIGEIKAVEKLPQRVIFAQCILRSGAGAATIFLEALQKPEKPSDVLRLLEVLPHALRPDMAEMALPGLLRHEVTGVRRRAAQMAGEPGYPRAALILLDALKEEKDAVTRQAFVESLGRLRRREAVEALSEIAASKSQPEGLRSTACAALARIGDPRAVPVLVKLYARGEKGLTKILGTAPPGLRAAAARALASFPGNKDAQETLYRAQEDRDSTVRFSARQARLEVLHEAFGDQTADIEIISMVEEITTESRRFGGFLVEAPFVDLCRRLAATEAAGTMSLHFEASEGRLYFDAGVVTAADFDGLRDQEAFNAMVSKREGLFLFLSGDAVPVRRVLLTVQELLEGRRSGDPS